MIDPDPPPASPGPHGRRPTSALLHRARTTLDELPSIVLVALVVVAMGAFVLASAVVVAEIIDEVMDGDSASHADERIVAVFEDARREPLTDLFRVVTRLADGWFVAIVVAITAAVLTARRRPALAIAVVLSSAGAAVITSVLKVVVGRDRPPPMVQLVDAAGDALPSGHAAQAVACWGAIALVVVATRASRALRIAALTGAAAIALGVGVSRVYLGVHWPSDVITGWIIGFTWLACVAVGSWLLWRLDRPRGWWGPPAR